MSARDNLALAHRFLSLLSGGASPDEVANLFSADLDWYVPGDDGALPWIGHKIGRKAAADFVRDSNKLIERIGLEIHDVIANDERAVILGTLSSRIKSTGRIIEGEFSIVLTIANGKVTRFLMLENSFAVATAARNVG